MPERKTEEEQHPESPGKRGWQVAADDVVPQMFVDKMVTAEEKDADHDAAEQAEKPVHPFFAEQDSRQTAGLPVFPVCFMLEITGQQRPKEQRQAQEHQHALPSEPAGARRGGLIFLVNGHGLRANRPLGTAAGKQDIRQQTDGNGDDQQEEENPPRRAGHHRQHDESLVSGRSNHHRHKGAETENAVGI